MPSKKGQKKGVKCRDIVGTQYRDIVGIPCKGFTIPAALSLILDKADPQKIRIGERAWNKTFDELSERTK